MDSASLQEPFLAAAASAPHVARSDARAPAWVALAPSSATPASSSAVVGVQEEPLHAEGGDEQKRPPTPLLRFLLSAACACIGLIGVAVALLAPWLYLDMLYSDGGHIRYSYDLRQFEDCSTPPPPRDNDAPTYDCIYEANDDAQLTISEVLLIIAAFAAVLGVALSCFSACTRCCSKQHSCSGPVFFALFVAMAATGASTSLAASRFDGLGYFHEVSVVVASTSAGSTSTTLLYPGLIAAAVAAGMFCIGASAIACCSPVQQRRREPSPGMQASLNDGVTFSSQGDGNASVRAGISGGGASAAAHAAAWVEDPGMMLPGSFAPPRF